MEKEIELIWKDINQDLQKFIFYKVKDEYASKDILQDVFIKIFLNINQLNDLSKMTSWIYQITRNTILDFYKKQKIFESIDTLDLPYEEEPTFIELTKCIQSKIDLLPLNYKEAVLLTTFQEYSQIELSNYLGISYSGAKSRVQRGKEKLHELILACQLIETDNKGKIVGHQLDFL